jgi:hypothetical protein
MGTNSSTVADRSRLFPFRYLTPVGVAMPIRLANPRPKDAL